jgi:ribosome biogenesis GTPase
MDSELQGMLDTYYRLGYHVIMTSVVTGEGIDELRRALTGRTSAFLGKSGVGKTSLLNALQPGLGLRVNQVNERTQAYHHRSRCSRWPGSIKMVLA